MGLGKAQGLRTALERTAKVQLDGLAIAGVLCAAVVAVVEVVEQRIQGGDKP